MFMLNVEKIPRLRIKSFRVEEYDWRGFIALTITVGYICLLVLRVPNTEMLGVAVGLMVGWYFSEKRYIRKPKIIKFPRATEKHPDYPKIKAKLVEALQQLESYNPAYDDLLVDEIAKTVIDIKTVDKKIDEAKNLTQLGKAIKTKAILLGMLEDCVEALAITRKSRLKHGEAELMKETMMNRLKAIMEEKKNSTV